MKTNSKYLIGFSIIALIFIFTFSLFTLNYKISKSDTKLNELTSRYSSHNYEIDNSDILYLYLEDRETLGKYLESSIINNLEKEGYTVEIVQEFKDNYGNQTLLVSLPEKNIKYNPFLPTSRIRMLSYYSSSGNTKYFNDFKNENTPSVVFEAEEGYQGELFIVSKIYLENNSRGILSLNAYREDLANSLGKAVGMIIRSK
ncbi:MAG TPA: hypothetical protein PKH80_04680 [Methanofastidiosum sp.]|nr:hypothetical protein [Methanofastidiosum sp.]HNU60902.1 hypothetical protein [Methanofastidiosum sp.]